MEIQNPRRILAVSQPDSSLLDLLKELTQTQPTIPPSGLAGSTHEWPVKTTYYTTTLPIWLDETASPQTWASDFLAPEAKEVLLALGAFIVCFRKPITSSEHDAIKELLKHVGEVVKEGCGYSWEGVCLAVACKNSQTPILGIEKGEWEDVCQDHGFEYVDLEESGGKNEYHERVGGERLKEALESNDWASDELGGGEELEDFLLREDGEGSETGSLGFGIDPKEMEEEMRGMKRAIYGGGDDDDQEEEEGKDDEEVEKLQAMMLKMQAVRGMGADLPEAERKRLAAKTVSEIMKTL